MKIAFINSVLDYGSTGKIVRDLSDELIKSGHEVLLVYGRHGVKDTRNTLNLNSKISFITHYVSSRFLGRHGLHSIKQTKELIQALLDFEPDVIHLHNVHGYYIHVPMLLEALKQMKVRILWTLHDTWLVSGSSAYFEYNGCKTWDDGCVECESTSDYPRADLIKRQKKNFNWKKEHLMGFEDLTFITPSLWLKDLISRTFLRNYPCVVVHNGIDLSVFHHQINPNLEALYKDKKVLLGVASVWEPRKGLDDFIALSKLVSSEFQIVLIGLSDSQIKSLPASIIGISRTSDANELAQYYSLAYAYLNPTYEDNYPTTNLEASACLTHVIAYDTGGNKEVEGLVVVEQGNVEAMHHAIINLSNPKSEIDIEKLSKEFFAREMLPYYTITQEG